MESITVDYVKRYLPVRTSDAHKGNFGRVLCIGGNAQMGGAIILTSSAALYSGAGLITVATDPVNRSSLHARTPEVMFSEMYDYSLLKKMIPKMDVVVIGPGLGRDQVAMSVFKNVINSIGSDQPLIIDADAIYLFGQYLNTYPANKHKKIILTPHLGEWENLSGLNAQTENPDLNRQKVDQLGVTLVLKKARTEIYYQDSQWKNTSGNPSMATGGMGDTLAGMIAGFLGQYADAKIGINSAVFLHSYIADQLAKTHYVTLPSQIIKAIPSMMQRLSTDNREDAVDA
ncbi:NAD(P)H-hydrate dehydratase [Fundicoccus culcitae]|uniref:ADP-dependent (S)-NAD(P)H-hydrate dehydratase n=1 Tax=Fundicoccus culcitae TaxID=2969821 RepID=A0ABY5P6S1_9LACT|nr:NAD(P)H-hydrate dehydratase [Fundicoccus culcitae]UUX34244.1 NAD(P)H-hydrate dehydratase [Fundicoccus culcitae]